MAIRFYCPLGHRLKVPDERAGKKGRCPICRQRLIVPDVSVVAPPASSVAAAPVERMRESMEGSADSNADLPASEPSAASVDEATAADYPLLPEMPPTPPPEAAPPAMSLPAASLETPTVEVTTVVETPLDHFDNESLMLGEAMTASVAPAESKGGDPQPGEQFVLAVDTDRPSPPVELPVVVPVVAATPPPLPPAAVSRNGVLPAAPAHEREIRAPARRLQWAAWVRGEAREGFAISRPTPRQVEVVYWLACLLPFAAVFCAAPAVPHVQFAGAPVWAQVLLCVAGLQAAYAAWLATVPDWSTLRVGTYFFGAVATIHLFTAIALLLLPDSSLASLGLLATRGTAAAWCVLPVAVSGSVAASCRWIDQRWRAGRL